MRRMQERGALHLAALAGRTRIVELLIGMSHVSHIHGSCHTYECSCKTYGYVMSHTQMNHVTRTNAARATEAGMRNER